jgi:hypothetical protein
MNGTKLDRFVLTEQKKAYIIPVCTYIIPGTPATALTGIPQIGIPE